MSTRNLTQEEIEKCLDRIKYASDIPKTYQESSNKILRDTLNRVMVKDEIVDNLINEIVEKSTRCAAMTAPCSISRPIDQMMLGTFNRI